MDYIGPECEDAAQNQLSDRDRVQQLEALLKRLERVFHGKEPEPVSYKAELDKERCERRRLEAKVNKLEGELGGLFEANRAAYNILGFAQRGDAK